ncbi:MAG: transcription antitermination factor NusB [Ignavibacteriae bacterium]|nr:transcription antitermination factor NusB [Ignavibacteriota bacterium]
MKSKRRKLREKVLQVLYAYEMDAAGLSEIMSDQLSEITSEDDKEFCSKLVNLIIANRKLIESKIEKRLVNWDVSRIAVVDLILLKIGVGEILYIEDIPPKVTINEIIEIAKEYSTAKSGKFINGILDAILADIKSGGNLKKAGRGLIENSLPKQ